MRRFVSIVGVVLLVATACGAPSPSGQEPSASGGAEKPVPGGRLVVASISDIKTLQPIISTDGTSSDAWGLVYIGLTRTDPDTGDVIPGLAERFSLSPDGLTVTYTLRDGLQWSDGVPFTMEDYKYTVEATARSKRTVAKSTFQDVLGWKDYVDGKADEVKGIQVKDGGKTIEIKLTKVFCPALRNLAGAGRGGIIPKHSFVQYFDNRSTDTSKNIDDNPLNLAPPAGMGPFTFKEWKPGVQVTLVANDRYYRGRPLVDEYVIKLYADQTAVKAALLTGEVIQAGVSPGDVDEVKATGKDFLDFYRLEGVSGYLFISWNEKATKAPWLADKRVRQALSYGLDVDAVMRNVVLGYGHRVFTHTPQANWAYTDPGFNKYPFDQRKAKELIESAGAKMGPDGIYRWTDGQPMQMRIETTQGAKVNETILQIAIEQYKAIGIKIDALLETFPALLDRTVPQNLDHEGAQLAWSTGLDPDAYVIWHSSQQGKDQFNWVHYSNPQVDSALEAGRNGPDCTPEARKKAYATFNKALNEDAPYVFLYSGDALRFFSRSLKGVEPKLYSTGSAWNIEKWWIKK